MVKETDLNHRSLDASSDERTAANIRGDIAATRDNIADTVDKLTDRVQETLDWRSYVERHPYAAIGVAAGAGLVAAGLFKKRKSPTDRLLDALADSVEDTTGRLRGALSFLPRTGGGPSGAVKAAVVGLLARKATELVQDHFNRPNQARYIGEDDRRHAAVSDVRSEYEHQDTTRRNHGTDDERFS
jgi:ElaB/YqjD/DUF883 family membrane-anchored ribosome-binding protein